MKKIITIMMTLVMVLSMSAASFAATTVSKSEAIKIALKSAHTTRAKVYGLEAELENRKYEIEFTKRSNKAEYEFKINKRGRILKKAIDYRYKKNHSKEKIGKAAAQKKVANFTNISLKTVKSGTCRYEYDYDDKEGKYEVKFRRGHYKYDVDVQAPDGVIMEFEKKYVK